MQDYEKLGAFYLGRPVDPASGEEEPEPLLYDAKDLCTHAVIVGMTGSGKTGLGVGLIEEAAIDGIPSLVIDPKGDMANLLLQFPKLRPEDFEPWVDPGAATRKGQTVPEFAKATAKMWKDGLAGWDQKPERVQRLADAAEVAIYTPGSTAARPLRVLKSFDAPSEAVRADREAMGERVESSVAGLLALLGIDADPLQSREAILLSNLLHHAWSAGRNLDLARLIGEVQKPPFERLGVLDLETFFPAKDRAKLAMTLNGVLASPGFAAWMEGEPLNIQNLLYTAEGKPRVAVLSIAHLSDSERMFFVSILLGEVLAWMRTQPGTSSLRALLYMDEIFGFFPPTAEPPSKRPMLTLLKQARAFGLGVVLSTQNPVDLDYKGLSNCGSWFLGRLQTERDKARVLDGLEGAMAEGGKAPKRADLDALLSGLGKRVFLLNNVHESGPVLFHTRWVLSYLRGPMTRAELIRLTDSQPGAREAAAAAEAAAVKAAPAPEKVAPPAEAAPEPVRVSLPEGIDEVYEPATLAPGEGEQLLYRPSLRTRGTLHYANARAKIDVWHDIEVTVALPASGSGVAWDEVHYAMDPPKARLRKKPEKGGVHAELTSVASRKTTWTSWNKRVKSSVYKDQALTLWKCSEPKLISEPGETQSAFQVRLRQASFEARDLALEKLRNKMEPKLERLEEKVRKAEQKVEKEEDQYTHMRRSAWLDSGASLLGALFGRKSRRSSAKAHSRTSKEKADVRRAEDDLDTVRDAYADLEKELETEIEALRDEYAQMDHELAELVVHPRKTDLVFEPLKIVWRPWRVSAEGEADPAW